MMDQILRNNEQTPETLYVLREESLPIPLNHIDVVRHAQTHLDILHEKKFDDYWKVDGLDSRVSQS